MKLLLITLVLLSGCAITDSVIISDKKVNLTPLALEPCKNLEPLTTISLEQLLEVTFKNIEVYKDCSSKQDNSIKLLKEFANIGP